MAEWLPWIGGYQAELPDDPAKRLGYVRTQAASGAAEEADRFRDALVNKYGPLKGGSVRYAEAYEISEYGAPLSAERVQALFPF